VIRKPTFAGTHGNGRDAPIPAVGDGLGLTGQTDPKSAIGRAI
jgi:hypothetical protein